jgi:hypothetical protein
VDQVFLSIIFHLPQKRDSEGISCCFFNSEDLKSQEQIEPLAKGCNLPFDRLRVNGLRLKLFSFSVRGELVEPQKNTFARGPKGGHKKGHYKYLNRKSAGNFPSECLKSKIVKNNT